MKYPQYLYGLAVHAIGDQVVGIYYHQLAGAGNSSGSAQPRLRFKLGDGFKDSCCGAPCCLWVFGCNECDFFVQVAQGRP